jgi:hypothetical protein
MMNQHLERSVLYPLHLFYPMLIPVSVPVAKKNSYYPNPFVYRQGE